MKNNIPCRKSNIGCFQCSIMVKVPWKDGFVHIDACLAKELFWLWDQGIKTVASCCDRHIDSKYKNGSICVYDEYVDRMIKLEYEYEILDNGIYSFIPKNLT